MRARLAGIYAANLADFAATLYFVSLYGLEVELNPFGAALLGNPAALIAYKVVGVLLLISVLWRYRHTRAARAGSWVCMAVYGALVVYHIFLLALSAAIR